MRTLPALACVALLSALSQPVCAEGLRLHARQDPWALWQGQLAGPDLTWGRSAFDLGANLPLGSSGLRGSLSLESRRWGTPEGLRASGGLLPNTPVTAWSMSAAGVSSLTGHVQPESETPGLSAYLGLGYAARWDKLGLSLNADFGLVSQRPSAMLRLGRDSGEVLWRNLQVAPMMQVNLSYAF